MISVESFVTKRRKKNEIESIADKIKKLPWYRRPIERTSFISKMGKDNKLYVHHNEWSQHTWIGPYKTHKEVDEVIDSYVEESLKMPLDRKQNNLVHSVWVEDEEHFFVKNE